MRVLTDAGIMAGGGVLNRTVAEAADRGVQTAALRRMTLARRMLHGVAVPAEGRQSVSKLSKPERPLTVSTLPAMKKRAPDCSST